MTEQTRGELYVAFHGKVLRYLMGKVESREDAEDLCAAVFEKVYRALPDFDGRRASVTTWIYTITRNTLTDYYRTRRLLEQLPEELADESDLDDALIAEETLARLAELLTRLPETERDVIVLRYYRGYTLTEIAGLIGLGYGMVKRKHKKALEALRTLLE